MINTPPSLIEQFAGLDQRTSPANVKSGAFSYVTGIFYRKGKAERLFGKTIALKSLTHITSLGAMGRFVILHEDNKLRIVPQSEFIIDVTGAIVNNAGAFIYTNNGKLIYGLS